MRRDDRGDMSDDGDRRSIGDRFQREDTTIPGCDSKKKLRSLSLDSWSERVAIAVTSFFNATERDDESDDW